MKKRIVSVLLCCVFLIFIFVPLSQPANALGDPLTISMLGAATAAIGQSWGITFSSTWTAQGVQNMLEQEINTYSGGNIAAYFGQEAIRLNAGKLIVGQLAYNGIINFLRDLSKKYNLGENRATLGFMFRDEYLQLGLDFDAPTITGFYTTCEPGTRYNLVYWNGPDGYKSAGGGSIPISYSHIESPVYTVLTNGIQSSTLMANDLGATRTHNTTISFSQMKQITGETYNEPVIGESTNALDNAVVLNPNQAWSGNVNGWEGPDTNLDQLVGQVFEDVADFNLDVEGEIIDIDPPGPVPTPAPGIDEIIGGLDDANDTLTGIDTNLDDLYAQGLEEIGTIGDARDAITGAIGTQTGALEGAIEGQTGALEGAIGDNAGVVSGAIDQAVDDVGQLIGTQTGAINQAISDNAGVVSGAVSQAVSDVQTAIGEQTAALDESLSATAEGVETIAEAIEDEEINWQKFDLKGLFPFCIPFDIYNMLKALDAYPTAPHVQLPFVIPSIGFSYNLDLDFSAFDSVAAIMRQMELICYGLALAWATSKVIKW